MRLTGYRWQHSRGITLSEVVISIAVSALSVAAVVSGYVLSARAADWISVSAAADISAHARMEQTRAAKWDTAAIPVVDELMSSNFPVEVVALNIPVVGGGKMYATNRTTILTVSENPPLKYVQVDCVWSYPNRGPFTNTTVAYRSPDQ